MKDKQLCDHRKRLYKWTLISTGLVGALPWAYSQDADDEGEIFELSPFSVEASSDTGYRASRTLAGGRTATEIKDVGTSIEVLTKDYLDDVGATNIEEFMQYTTGGEVGGSAGNITGFGETQTGDASTTAARANPSANVRVRGIAAPDSVRNYYKTSIPMETYNTDRIDINRGANSMLFGLGSPAGLINSNYQKAVMNDKSKINFDFDSEGSVRTALNFNRELVDGKLAVRVAALRNRKKYHQNPSYRDDDRIYGAITFKPLENTTLRAHFEDGEVYGNAPDTLLPSHAIDSFIEYRTPVDVFYNLQTFGDSAGPDAEQYAALTPEEQARFVDPDSDAALAIGGSRMFGFATVYDGANGSDPSFAFRPQFNSGWIEEGNSFWDPEGTNMVNGDAPEMQFYRNMRNVTGTTGPAQGFTDLETFNFAEENFGGNTDFYSHDFRTYNVALEQLFLNGQVGFEIGYDFEEKENASMANFNGWKGEFQIDINQTLLLPATNADGTFKTDAEGNVVSEVMANPNFGRPYYLSESTRSASFEERETYRATAFARYDFEDKHDNFLKWLGSHTVTGLFDKSSEKNRTANTMLSTYSDDFNLPWSAGATGTESPSHGYRRTSKMVYMGPAIQTYINDPFNPETPISMSDIIIQASDANLLDLNPTAPLTFWNLGPDAEGANWTHLDLTEDEMMLTPELNHGSTHPNNYGTEPEWYTGDRLEYWDTGTLGATWVPSTNRTRKTVVESVAINLQSKFFNDSLVANIGYREDTVDNYLNTSMLSNHLLTQTGYDAATVAEQESVPADLVGALPESYVGNYASAASPEYFRYTDGELSVFDKGPTGEGSIGYNGVYHVPNDLGFVKLPDGFGLSLHYNYSKNFVPDASRNTFVIGQNGADYSFETLSSPIGETEDFGFTISLGNKFTARINKFETSIQDNTTAVLGNTLNALVDFATRAHVWANYDITQLDPNGSGVIDVDANGDPHRWAGNERYDVARTYQMRDATQWVVDDGWMPSRIEEGYLILRENGSGWTKNGSFPGLTDTEDRVSRGYELNMTYNPTRNWRIALNGSQLESVSSNVGPVIANVMDRFFEDYEKIKTFTYWEAADTNYNKNAAVSRWLEPRVSTYYQYKLQEGKETNETREWSANMVTNYKFTEGRFKGFSVGAAVRWRSEGVLGYPMKEYNVNEDTVIEVPDVDNPYRGSASFNVDFNAGYTTKIMNDKVRYTTRLHLKNINNLSSDNLTTVRVNEFGDAATVRWDAPLEIRLSNSFDF